MSLKNRISLVFTALAASLLLAGGGLWLRHTRAAIHEEVEAATKVAERWLAVAAQQTREGNPAWNTAALVTHIQAAGRLRANALEVVDARGKRLYLSPPPSYKAGRTAPAWFADLIEPTFQARRLDAGELRIVLHPDSSRAALDAWDELSALAAWTALFLISLCLSTRYALDRALRPLGIVETALAHAAEGRFEHRLPVFGVAELDSLGEGYNRMVETLSATRAENRLLESHRDFARELHRRLTEERRHITRELHDELGQGITAVRSLAGSVIQRAGGDAQLNQCGKAILAMTSEMQDGVRAILDHLQQPATAYRIDETLAAYCRTWAASHPEIKLHHEIAPLTDKVDDDTALTLLRLLQESLTNVARHAGASNVAVNLSIDNGGLHLVISDNGRGLKHTAPPTGHYGLAGMHERIAARHGRLHLERPAAGGLRVRATLPYSAAPVA